MVIFREINPACRTPREPDVPPRIFSIFLFPLGPHFMSFRTVFLIKIAIYVFTYSPSKPPLRWPPECGHSFVPVCNIFVFATDIFVISGNIHFVIVIIDGVPFVSGMPGYISFTRI